MANGNGQPGPAGNQAQPHDQDKWDFYTVLVVVAGLVVVLALVVGVFHDKPTTLVTILGIAVPVLGAAVGYSGGNARGKAVGTLTGRQEGRQEVKNRLLGQVAAMREQAAGIMNPVRAHGATVAGQQPRVRLFIADEHQANGEQAEVASNLDHELQAMEDYLRGL